MYFKLKKQENFKKIELNIEQTKEEKMKQIKKKMKIKWPKSAKQEFS